MNITISTLSFCFTLFMLLMIRPVSAALPVAEPEDTRFRELLDFAYIADSTYKDKDVIETVLADKGYVLTSHGQLPGYYLSYFVASNETLKRQIVAVRGTSNIENAMVDIAFKLLPNDATGIKLHQGFGGSADYLFETIKPILKKDFRIDTTGHSLGGAAALILAMYLDAQGYDVGKVITYGQPKVTNVAGSRKYGHLDVTRVVMPKDVVPLVPPLDPLELMNMDIYWHQGTEIVLQQDNTYSELEGMDSMLRATDFLNDVPGTDNVENHFMTTYIDALKTKLVQPRQVPYKNDFSVTDLFKSTPDNNER
jgi:hypothetical protein